MPRTVKVIITIVVVATAIALAIQTHAHAYTYYPGDQTDDYGPPPDETYTTVPFGNPYSGQQGTGFTTYDGSYTRSCMTMRMGLGWVTTCR